MRTLRYLIDALVAEADSFNIDIEHYEYLWNSDFDYVKCKQWLKYNPSLIDLSAVTPLLNYLAQLQQM